MLLLGECNHEKWIFEWSTVGRHLSFILNVTTHLRAAHLADSRNRLIEDTSCG